MSNNPTLYQIVSDKAREMHAHTLQEVAKSTPDRKTVHALLLGMIQAEADYLRVTYGPEKAAETFYAIADDIVAKSVPATALTTVRTVPRIPRKNG